MALPMSSSRRRAEPLEEAALGCELHTARVAVEEARADGVFERADQRAECRLRQVAGLRRAREVAVLGQREKGAQLPRGEVGRLSHGLSFWCLVI
jgi:hypothetical protein